MIYTKQIIVSSYPADCSTSARKIPEMGIRSSPLVHKTSCNICPWRSLEVPWWKISFQMERGDDFFHFSLGISHMGQACRDQLGLSSQGTVWHPSSLAPGSSGPGADPKLILRRGLLIKNQITSHKNIKVTGERWSGSKITSGSKTSSGNHNYNVRCMSWMKQWSDFIPFLKGLLHHLWNKHSWKKNYHQHILCRTKTLQESTFCSSVSAFRRSKTTAILCIWAASFACL